MRILNPILTPVRAGNSHLRVNDTADKTLLTISARYDVFEDSAQQQVIRTLNSHAALVDALSRILRAHESGNNGAVMGEAVLCQQFASLARDALAKAGVTF